MLGDDHGVLGLLLDMVRGRESSQREGMVVGIAMAWCSLGFLSLPTARASTGNDEGVQEG
jgi:hypothetical protein